MAEWAFQRHGSKMFQKFHARPTSKPESDQAGRVEKKPRHEGGPHYYVQLLPVENPGGHAYCERARAQRGQSHDVEASSRFPRHTHRSSPRIDRVGRRSVTRCQSETDGGKTCEK